jgi:hypothetical protein
MSKKDIKVIMDAVDAADVNCWLQDWAGDDFILCNRVCLRLSKTLNSTIQEPNIMS